MNTLQKQFGKRLKSLRVIKGISQQQLAQSAGLSTSFISGIERGLYAPSFETIEKISKTLQLSIKDLFDF